MSQLPLSPNHEEENLPNRGAARNRLYEAIINTADLSIISTTPQGIITSFNKAAEELLGYRADEVIGKVTLERFHDSTEILERTEELKRDPGIRCAPGFETFIILAQSKTVNDRKEWTYIRKDGSRFPVLLSIAALHDDAQQLMGYAAIASDITGQKEIQRRVQESEAQLQDLVSSIDDIVFELDEKGRFNKIWVKSDEYLFLPREKIYGRTLTEMFGVDFAKPFEDGLAHVLLTGETFSYEYPSLAGEERWYCAKYGLVYENGHPTKRVSVCIQDITARKKIELSLRKSEERSRSIAVENAQIFNNSFTLSALATMDGYLKKVNPAWEKTLGWSRDELLSKNFFEFIHPDDVQKTHEMIQFISSGQSIHTFENRYRCKDGSYRWLLWSSSPDLANQLIYTSATDITSRKKFEEELLISKRNLEVAAFELQEQNHQLDEFAHIISHNLRAPVGNIKALLNFINEGSQIEDYRLIFEKIRNVTANISETMNELMETIKIKKNSEIERVELRFKDILDKVVQSLEGELIESGATVTYDFNNAPKIYYSKPYLESILQNLIGNAIKYRSPDRIPKIFLSTDLVMTGIELRVTDNGLGIDMEKYGTKLFGLHKTFHENTEARGVGLFLTKTQIEALGGSIAAESEVNKGTTFIIQF